MKERAATSIDVKIGQRVRARRLALGVSQDRLAAIIGVTFQQVQKYERGHNRIACSRVVEIAAALKVAPSYFFEDLRPSRGRASVDALMASEDGARLAHLFASIKKPSARKRMLDLAEAVAET